MGIGSITEEEEEEEEDGEVTQYTTISNSSTSTSAAGASPPSTKNNLTNNVKFADGTASSEKKSFKPQRRGTGVHGLGLGGGGGVSNIGNIGQGNMGNMGNMGNHSLSPNTNSNSNGHGQGQGQNGFSGLATAAGAMSPVDLTPPASMSTSMSMSASGGMAAALSMQKDNAELKAKVYSLENRLREAKDENAKKANAGNSRYVDMCVHVYTYIHTPIYLYTYTYIHLYTYTYILTHTYTHIYSNKQSVVAGEAQLKHAAFEISSLKHQLARSQKEAQYYKSLLQDVICQMYTDADAGGSSTINNERQTRTLMESVNRSSSQLQQLQEGQTLQASVAAKEYLSNAGIPSYSTFT